VLLAEGEIAVATGDGLLALDLVQLAGKKPATARDFARGRRDFIGAVLGGGV
jgi:methionyl-tRNA formyltransferase